MSAFICEITKIIKVSDIGIAGIEQGVNYAAKEKYYHQYCCGKTLNWPRKIKPLGKLARRLSALVEYKVFA
jgi:hypothetical protein